ncbi:MAG: PadR family transcriptional regulator [Spirochaetes bacterium GWF1_51_8]|nr:MAG: PadR family transcriptional regulator [Spirochaetes bacterium GWF1_51_8]
MNRLERDFFLGFIKMHILHHTAKEKVYGKEFRDELARHGYEVSFGTLYPIFHRLERDGFLRSEEINVNGKIRRYYGITQNGQEILELSKIRAKELFMELFEEYENGK